MRGSTSHTRSLFAPFPINWHGWVGLFLIAVFWPLNWVLPGLRTHVLFFPLWLGYILVVDWLTLRRSGTSLLTRSPFEFVLLFVASAPAWWVFEVINWRMQNWEYLAREMFTNLQYFIFASICFSTVMPAVFGTAELMRTFRWINVFARGPRVRDTATTRMAWFVLGWVLMALMMIWPRYFFPFVWMSLFFILEPINAWLGRRTILSQVDTGDWRSVATLWIGTLICGFFWEMWNFYSYPKWIYHVPFVGFWHVFEMPLLGYLGYLPFGLELYGMVHLLWWRDPDIRV